MATKITNFVSGEEKQGLKSAMLYALLASDTCAVRDLIGFAKGLPAEWVLPMAASVGETVMEEYRRNRGDLRRRQLVILTALLSRLTFEIEAVPQDPDAHI